MNAPVAGSECKGKESEPRALNRARAKHVERVERPQTFAREGLVPTACVSVNFPTAALPSPEVRRKSVESGSPP